MLRIVLIRPGSTSYDEQGRVQGTLDLPLTAKGTEEVARLVDELRPLNMEVVYVSGSQPSIETGETLANALGIPCKRLEKMQNLEYGLWQGMRIDEIRRLQPKVFRQWQDFPRTVRPPQGETIDEAEQRVISVLAKLTRKHREGTIGLVVPEPLASVIHSLISQRPLGNLWKAPESHGSWEVLEINEPISADSLHASP